MRTVLLLGLTSTLHAQLTWDSDTVTTGPQDGSGTWNTSNTNWWTGSANGTWDSGAAIFGSALNVGTSGASLGTVTVVGTVDATSITFQGLGNYTITGGTINLVGSTPTIDITSTSASGPNISSVLAGSNGLTIKNSGNASSTLVFGSAANNTYTGQTNLNGLTGAVESKFDIHNVNAFGAAGAGNGTVAAGNVRLNLNIAGTFAEDIKFTNTQSGATKVSTSGLVSVFASNTYSGNITLDRSGTGTGDVLTQFRAGFNGAQTFIITGDVTSSGTTNGAVVAETWTNYATDKVELRGAVNDGAGGPQLKLNVTGAGVTKLTHATGNTYTGLTTVYNTSTLIVNNVSGSGTGFGAVDVTRAGATLGGTGIIAPTGANGLTVGTATAGTGTVAPGDGGVGALTMDLSGTTGKATFNSGASFSFDLAAPGTSDLFAFIGTSSGDIVFNGNKVNFADLGGLSAGLYTLFTFDNASAYTGTLTIGTGLTSFAGSSFIYNANSIQLNVVPEPTTWALIIMGVMTLSASRRRLRDEV